jgi:hypothetical protein
MKKQIVKNISQAMKNKVAPVLFLFLSVNFAPLSAISREVPNTAVVKYIGTVQDQVVFQLNYENPQGGNFYVTVKDEEGITLYSGKFNDKNFTKQFRFYKSELNISKLSFTVLSQEEKQSQTFQVATISRVVEDVVVTKL